MLGKLTRHLLLLTATPHNGKEEDFQLFMGLLDEDRFEGRFREGVRKVDVWTARYRLATVPFPEEVPGLGPGIDPFFNANRPEDFDRAAILLEHLNSS